MNFQVYVDTVRSKANLITWAAFLYSWKKEKKNMYTALQFEIKLGINNLCFS